MVKASSKSWVRTVILVGVAYFVIGVVFGRLANSVVSDQLRFMWRLAAWLISAALFVVHIWYEHFRMHNPAAAVALHAAMAVGLAAFLLAVAATIHALMIAANVQYWRFLLALVLWPVLTAIPAFVVAFIVSTALGLKRRSI